MQLFLFIIILSSFTLAIPGKKNVSENKPTQIEHDSDDFLNDAIQAKLERFDTTKFESYASSINQTLYTHQLTLAHTFARGMFEGLHLEVQEWLENKKVMQKTAAEFERIFKNKGVSREVQESKVIHKIFIKALQLRTRWYLYTIALRNLLRFQKPCGGFFELVVNVFIESENQDALEDIQVNSNTIKRREKLVTKLGSTYATKHHSTIQDFTYFKKEGQRLRRASTNKATLIDQLEEVGKKVRDMEKLHDIDSDESDTVQENIAHIKFQSFFDILLHKSKFKDLLHSSRRTISPLTVVKNESFSVTVDAHYFAFVRNPNARFIAEKFRAAPPAMIAMDPTVDIVDVSIKTDRSVNSLHRRFTFSILHFLKDLKIQLKVYGGALFTPNSEEYTRVIIKDAPIIKNSPSQEELIEEVQENTSIEDSEFHWHTSFTRAPAINPTTANTSTPKLKLKPNALATLKTLIGTSDALGSANGIKWVEILQLIDAMKGSVTSNGGSIRMISLPLENTFPIRFDCPHPSTNLGVSVYSLRRIFKRWNVDVELYE